MFKSARDGRWSGAVWLLLGGSILAAPAHPAPLDVAPKSARFTDAAVPIGDPAAPVTVTVFLSTTCAHCAAFEAAIYPFVERNYIRSGRVRLLVRELPTAPVIVSSAGFLLARCIGRSGYWEAVRKLLQAQRFVLSAADETGAIRRSSEVVGLSEAETARCLGDDEAVRSLNERRQVGLDAGVDSTPTFIFNGKTLRPGDRLAGGVYAGGELTQEQFAAAVRGAPVQAKSADPAR